MLVTAMVTPFDAQGAIDGERAAALAAFQLEQGASQVLLAGTTGEGAALAESDWARLLDAVHHPARDAPAGRVRMPDEADPSIGADQTDADARREGGGEGAHDPRAHHTGQRAEDPQGEGVEHQRPIATMASRTAGDDATTGLRRMSLASTRCSPENDPTATPASWHTTSAPR